MIDQIPSLPVFPIPEHLPAPETWRLTIDGAVQHSVQLDLDGLRALPAVEFDAPFRCEEGWEVASLHWRGVGLHTLLARAQPQAGARFVAVHARQFVAELALPDLQPGSAVLAYELDGAPLPVAHGGPLRFVLPGAPCYESVKWVDRLELRQARGESNAREIAMARIQQRRRA